MLIDEIIEQLMTEYVGVKRAKEFLDSLDVTTKYGAVRLRWSMTLQTAILEATLAREKDPRLATLHELIRMVIEHHRKIHELEQALGVCNEDEYTVVLTREELDDLGDGDPDVCTSVIGQILKQARAW